LLASLSALLVRSAAPDWEITLWCEEARWEPPHPPFGTEPLRFPVVRGAVAVAALGEKERGVVVEACAAKEGEELALPELLVRTACSEDKRGWHKQLLWTLAWHVDRQLAGLLLQEGARPQPREASKAEGEKLLTRYLVAHKQRLAEGGPLSLCMDAGRVGLQTVFSGVVVRPDNVGMIYPPQATAPRERPRGFGHPAP
jgi:hypothetical protein